MVQLPMLRTVQQMILRGFFFALIVTSMHVPALAEPVDRAIPRAKEDKPKHSKPVPRAVTPKNSVKVEPAAATPKVDTSRIIRLQGDFSRYCQAEGANACGATSTIVDVTVSDGNLKGTPGKGSFQDERTLIVKYDTAGSDLPMSVGLKGNKGLYSFPYKLYVAESDQDIRRTVAIQGDFCRSENDVCTTGMFQGNAPLTGVNGTLTDTANTPVPVELMSLSKGRALVSYREPAGFRPTTLHLYLQGKLASFPYVPEQTPAKIAAVYRVATLGAKCKLPSCSFRTLQARTNEPKDTLSPTWQNDDDLFISGMSSSGELPLLIYVELPMMPNVVLIGRRITRPANDQAALGVDMTLMDHETIRRNYGASLAEQYFAVKLDIANRTTKRLQFNKAAVYFDVDFVASSGEYAKRKTNAVADVTLDFVRANVYDAPFAPCNGHDPKAGEDPCRIYRFGIEQNQHVFADSYLSVLGSFDYTTQRTDRGLKLVELLGSTLTTIATGGAVAQMNNTAFRDSASILAGVFIPNVRSIVMNNAEINRERANLAAQTFQEIVQIAPMSHAYTVILLPRYPLLAVDGAERKVLIDRIVDVHIDPDVVNGVKDPPVPANHLELGYTRDQVRQSLGEPESAGPGSGGGYLYTYKAGPFKDVSFNAQGQAINWSSRTSAEQVIAEPTLNGAQQVAKNSFPGAKTLKLTDGRYILVNITGEPNPYVYDKAGKSTQGTYELKYDAIKKLATNKVSKKDFEKAVGAYHLPDARDTWTQTGKVLNTATYDMPDIEGGTIIISLEKLLDGKTDDGDNHVVKVDFGGNQP